MKFKNRLSNVRVEQARLQPLPRHFRSEAFVSADENNAQFVQFHVASLQVHGAGHLQEKLGNHPSLAADSPYTLDGVYLYREWQTLDPNLAPYELRLAIATSGSNGSDSYRKALVGNGVGQAVAFRRGFAFEQRNDGQLQSVPRIDLSFTRTRQELRDGALEVVDLLTAQSLNYACEARIVATEPGQEEPWFDGTLGDFRRNCMAETVGAAALYY